MYNAGPCTIMCMSTCIYTLHGQPFVACYGMGEGWLGLMFDSRGKTMACKLERSREESLFMRHVHVPIQKDTGWS